MTFSVYSLECRYQQIFPELIYLICINGIIATLCIQTCSKGIAFINIKEMCIGTLTE